MRVGNDFEKDGNVKALCNLELQISQILTSRDANTACFKWETDFYTPQVLPFLTKLSASSV